MIKSSDFYFKLNSLGVDFYTGVPDSLLKPFCAYISDTVKPQNHVIAANEGASTALAIGYNLSTGKLPLVYMQNSGLGNAVNPLISLADKDVYSIPMLLMIGWRGEPGVKDEPQHVKQGKITLTTLDTMGIPYVVVEEHIEEASDQLEQAVEYSKTHSCAFALVVKKDTFEPYKLKQESEPKYEHRREDAIRAIVDSLSSEDVVVSTTGMASRELFEYRKHLKHNHGSDFLTVGGMGHASQIALGIAIQQTEREVVCIDGDGAVLMHLGSLAINGQSGLGNFKHIVINNGAHDSVGGQPTVCMDINIPEIAKSCGYLHTAMCDSMDDLPSYLSLLSESKGPSLLEVRVAKGNRADLGRPTATPLQNKEAFMANLSEC